MARVEKVRFAVGAPEGPRSSTWKLWVDNRLSRGKPKGEIYLGNRGIAGDLKVSLHRSGQWQVAFTSQSEFAAKRRERGLPRQTQTWERPSPDKDGVVYGYGLYFPTQELTDTPYTGSKVDAITWIPAASPNQLIEFHLLITTPDADVGDSSWPGEDKGTELLKRIPLPDEEILWLVHRVADVSPNLQSLIDKEKSRWAKIEASLPTDFESVTEEGASLRSLTLLGGTHGAVEIQVYP